MRILPFIIAVFWLSNSAFSQGTDNCDSIPELNQGVVDFVKTKIKKRVGRGECWDLAAEALNSVNAKWNGQYVFGKEVSREGCLYPGDIIQMERVTLRYEKDGGVYKEKMPHHTAVVYEVKGKGVFIIAHQNTSIYGKKVGLSEFDLNYLEKGKIIIYRPVS